MGRVRLARWANTTDTSDVLTWTYNLPGKIVFKGDEKRDSDVTAATNKFDDVNIGDGAYTPSEDDMQRGRLAETFPESYSAGLSENVVNEQTKARMFDKTYGAVLEGYDAATYKYTGEFAEADGSYKDPSSGYDPLPTGQAGDLTVADLVGVPYDDERWDSLISQMSFADLETLVGYCGWSNPAIRSIGKNFAVDMDGCHGLHDLTTAWTPTATRRLPSPRLRSTATWRTRSAPSTPPSALPTASRVCTDSP